MYLEINEQLVYLEVLSTQIMALTTVRCNFWSFALFRRVFSESCVHGSVLTDDVERREIAHSDPESLPYSPQTHRSKSFSFWSKIHWATRNRNRQDLRYWCSGNRWPHSDTSGLFLITRLRSLIEPIYQTTPWSSSVFGTLDSSLVYTLLSKSRYPSIRKHGVLKG